MEYHTLSSGHYQDIVFAFFQNCYHLKDWIKNDNAANVPKQTVEQFINQNRCMKICADICNGVKHLTLSRQRSGQSPEFRPRHYTLILGGEPIVKVKWSITTKSGDVDAFDIASECVQKWEDFFTKHNL